MVFKIRKVVIKTGGSGFWPELFNLDEPKPLKVGVLDDIQQDIAAHGLVIGAGGVRYDLNGQPCGEVTPEQQQEAADEQEKPKNTI